MNLINLKIALRRLSGSPFISIINLGGLALGIACAYLGFSYAQQEFAYEKDFTDSDKIFRISVDFMNMGGFAVGPENLPEYLSNSSSAIESFSRVSIQGAVTLEEPNHKATALVLGCDSSYFQLFDYPLATEGTNRSLLSTPDQAVISADFAKKWFGHVDAIGEDLIIPLGEEEKHYTVSAVVDNGSIATHLIGDIWIPIYPFLKQEKSWYSAAFYTYFKFKEKSNLVTLEADLEFILKNEIFEKYGKKSGLTFSEWKNKPDSYRFIIYPLKDIHLKSAVNFEMSAGGNLQKVQGFLLIGLLILLVAVANYINLTTARSFVRSKEIGIKKSIGASKISIFKQFISESFLESIIVVIGSAVFVNILLKAFELSTNSLLLQSNTLSLTKTCYLILFGIGVSLAAAIYPAFFLSTIRPINLLRDQRPVPTAAKLRNTLVIFQFIITAVLICSTLVIFFQLKYIANKDLGFDQKGLMVIENMNALGTSVNSFKQEITESPLVEIASFANSIPGNSSIYQSSYQTTEMQNSVALRTIPVDANFIETMGISLIEGSNFRDKINLDSTVAIINEAAKKALGLDITIGQEISQGQKVIGLVSDFHMASLREGIEPIVMEYTPTGNILALRLDPRKRASLSDFIYRINSLWNEMSPNTAMQYSFIDDTFAKMSTQEKIEATGMVALTFMALIIACLGLVGLATFTMKKREKEIGIRKTLGSSATEIVTLLSLEFLRLVMIALPIAIPVAWYFMDKWLQNFAYHISLHWWIFLLGGILSIVIAFIVVSFQSIRAATVNPVASLHNQ